MPCPRPRCADHFDGCHWPALPGRAGLPHIARTARARRQGWRAGPCAGLLLACVTSLAAPASAVAAGDMPQVQPALPSMPAPASLAEQVLHLVNQHRSRQGLAAWAPDAALTAIASAHSQQMAQRRQIGHDGFDARFAQAQRRHCVENLAAGFDRAEPLLAAWLASPSHRDNLLATRPRQAGLGQVAGYVTLMACEPAAP